MQSLKPPVEFYTQIRCACLICRNQAGRGCFTRLLSLVLKEPSDQTEGVQSYLRGLGGRMNCLFDDVHVQAVS